MFPLVTIIIPIYKVEHYLQRCIDSVIGQTYTNLEIILVDDGSPDCCPQICDEYASKDSRIIVIHKKNGGLSDARNEGTSHASGAFVYYLDSDDELPSDAIENMINYTKNNTNIEIVVGKMLCPQNKSLYKKQLYSSDYIIKNNIDFRKCFCKKDNAFPVNACNKLISLNFIKKNNLYFEKGIIHEDELWMFIVSKVAANVICINKITYIRHLNPNSITTATPINKKNYSWGIILKKIFSEIDSPVFPDLFYKYFLLLNKKYSTIDNDDLTLYNEVWERCITSTIKNGYKLLTIPIIIHKTFFKFFSGHGTGFIIWFLLTKWYKLEQE